MRKSLVILVAVLEVGCQARPFASRTFSSRSQTDVVTLISVSASTLSDYDTVRRTLKRNGQKGLTLYRYRVRDDAQRRFDIYAFSTQPAFKPGACLTRWQNPRKATYPRLSIAAPNCMPLQKQPNALFVPTTQRPSPRLKRVAFLNQWIDKKEPILRKAWGKPDQILSHKNGMAWRYHYKYTMSGHSGDQHYTAVWRCQTDWYVRQGVVWGYSETGNACY